MQQQANPGAPGGRLIVINLDGQWRFVQLVRQLALDLLGRPFDRRVEFRTLVTEAPVDDAPDRMVWGARWPLVYQDDPASLLADLDDDLADLTGNKIGRLTVLFVLPDRDEGRRREIVRSVGRSVAAVLDRSPGLADRVDRWAVVRGRPENAATVPPEVARFLSDVQMRGRPPLDYAVALAAPAAPDADGSEPHHFILLRCLCEIVDSWRDARPTDRGGAGEEIAFRLRTLMEQLRGSPAALQLPGRSPPLFAQKMAKILAHYHVQASSSGFYDTGPAHAGPASAGTVQVEELLKSIRQPIALTEEDFPAAPDSLISDILATTGSRFWQHTTERALLDAIDQDGAALRDWAASCLDAAGQLRRSRHDHVISARDREMRARIGSLFLSSVVSSQPAPVIVALQQRVASERTGAIAEADQLRLEQSVLNLPPGNTDEPRPGNRRSLDHLPEMRDYRAATEHAAACFARLVPRFAFGPILAVVGGALATMIAHAWMQMPRSGAWADIVDRLSPPVIPVAFLLAFAFGYLLIAGCIGGRHRRFVRALAQVERTREALATRIRTSVMASLNHAILTQRLVWLDLLHSELGLRAREHAAHADAMAAIARAAGRSDPILLTTAETARFFQENAGRVGLERVSRWLNFLIRQIKVTQYGATNPMFIDFVTPTGGATKPDSDAQPTQYLFYSTLFVSPVRLELIQAGTAIRAGESRGRPGAPSAVAPIQRAAKAGARPMPMPMPMPVPPLAPSPAPASAAAVDLARRRQRTIEAIFDLPEAEAKEQEHG